MRQSILLLCSILLFTTAINDSVFAQQGGGYGPTGGISRTPTLSPYLDLFRINGGVLPNYQQFVQPQLRIRRALENQTRINRRQSQAINALSAPAFSPSPIQRSQQRRPGFMNYRGFYPQLNR